MELGTKTEWGKRSIEDTLASFGVDPAQGLLPEEVEKRRVRYGENRIAPPARPSLVTICFTQLKSPFSFILLGAALVMVWLGDVADTIVILIALLINVGIGASQEERAGKAFARLLGSDTRHAFVLRGGKKMYVAEAELVPGDIVFLEAGSKVPADARLIHAYDLEVNESALTGEWLAVSKQTLNHNPAEHREQNTAPAAEAEREAVVWMGTLVETGSGVAVVTAVGGDTVFGGIARELSIVSESQTPLEQGIRRMLRQIGLLLIVLVFLVIGIGILRHEPIGELLRIAVALAVASIPEGLPAAVTIVLALGMEALLSRGGLVKNLHAAQTLGATTYILTDKTGTLTEAKMKLKEIVLFEEAEASQEDARSVLRAAVLASDAFVEEGKDAPEKLTVHGRPLEKAILLRGLEDGLSPEVLRAEEPRITFLKFDSARRFAASLHRGRGKNPYMLYLTGAPEVLLEHASATLVHGKKTKLTPTERKMFADLITRKSASGLRLLAVARMPVSWDLFPAHPDPARRDLVTGCTFLGLLAFVDPIRADVRDAIKEARAFGAHVIMITGDNPETARAIARATGISEPGAEDVLRGEDIERMHALELSKALIHTSIIARALPMHKLMVARALKEQGEVVAMTGDGINDAPALRAANIGVAVGSGTEVAKDAADLILLNDSFSIIVSAIEEGRRIMDNLRKIIAYLLSTSFSEIIVVGGAFAAGATTLPFLPMHILVANIVQEGVMSFPFAFEKCDREALYYAPKEQQATHILSRKLTLFISVTSIASGLILLGLFFFAEFLAFSPARIHTLMFTALSLSVVSFTFSLKSLTAPLWRSDLFSNHFLIIALLINCGMLLVILTVPFLREFFSLVPLTLRDMALLGFILVANMLMIETVKYAIMQRK